MTKITDVAGIPKYLLESLEKSKDVIEKFHADLADKFFDVLDSHINYDLEHNVSGHIDRQVEDTIQKLLCGDLETIKELNILSKYDFGNLTEIRKKIWEACAPDIENSLIQSLVDQNTRLTDSLEFERKYRR